MYRHLRQSDPEIANLVGAEIQRQVDTIRLIASENYASAAVQEAVGSPLANKYSEGYAGKRYYEGQAVIDQVETLAIDRVKALFGAEHVNVQPYSGSPANQAVYFALLDPGDTVMGLGLPHGGHLTHGWKVNFSGRQYNAVQYAVDRETELIDYDAVRALAHEHKPKMIIAGITAYPRFIDWEFFRTVADEVGAYFMADIAHISGLVAAGVHPSPVPFADVVTSTTHKTLRGPRGGMIMCKSALAKKIDRAVFPGLQGGPHNNTTAGIAVAAAEAATDSFREYAQRVVDDAKALGEALSSRGYRLITGGTDNHMLIVDVTNKGVSGKKASKALDRAGIVCNFNSIPFDPRKPFDPSGIRIGAAAVATRGMGPDTMETLAGWMDEVITAHEDDAVIDRVRNEVREFVTDYPAPGLETE
ncbi:MAG: glycine hydroxymethyltransferase [Bradymonadia bacterium]|jgi:glycine hydroxymethyltransferase